MQKHKKFHVLYYHDSISLIHICHFFLANNVYLKNKVNMKLFTIWMNVQLFLELPDISYIYTKCTGYFINGLFIHTRRPKKNQRRPKNTSKQQTFIIILGRYNHVAITKIWWFYKYFFIFEISRSILSFIDVTVIRYLKFSVML